MDGVRVQNHWAIDVEALVQVHRHFETLICAAKGKGAAHRPEDGRYVEYLLREFLVRHLPKGLEVLTGFIHRPAVKTGKNGRERKNETDIHSTQLDIIVFDSVNYPVFQRFGDSAIVPPEGFVGIISVKKCLRDTDVGGECSALYAASKLCQSNFKNDVSKKLRGPFLALVSVNSAIKKKKETLEWIYHQIEASYPSSAEATFDQLIGFVGALDQWSIFKQRPSILPTEATYVGFNHSEEHSHLGFQFLLTGLLSVFYDETRRNVRRPGFTAFPAGRAPDRKLGKLCKSPPDFVKENMPNPLLDMTRLL